MYNVMLVDDDFPVIEFLSNAIDWKVLGLRLAGAFENGLDAWEQAEPDMPDILITDIGMPKMDGLELVGKMKQRKPNLRVAILSCHSEFQYAQQAMRLNVQDYLLKDALSPEELERLLHQFKHSLDGERASSWQETQMKQLVSGTKELRKEQWFKNFIEQPLLSPAECLLEARQLGLLREGEACLPVIGYMDSYRQVKRRFLSDQTLRFALNNVIEEALREAPVGVLHVSYSSKQTFLLFAYRPGLKQNIHDQASQVLKRLQQVLRSTLKLSMSFITEEGCMTPEALKQRMVCSLDRSEQRFYLEPETIAKGQSGTRPAGDLFALYHEASGDFRDLLLNKRADAVEETVGRWVSAIREREYTPEAVKDWVFKLLLDLKLKMQSLRMLRPGFSAETLHNEIADMDALSDLKPWLIAHMQTLIALAGIGSGTSVRPEVMQACQFVSLHLGRRISLEEVADHLFLNPSYFSRMFKKETGENFIEYVTRMKMDRAKELLDQTGHSVGQICERLGYDNQSYFIKIFKSHTGVTPVEYRG